METKKITQDFRDLKIEYLHNIILNLTSSINAKNNLAEDLRFKYYELKEENKTEDLTNKKFELFKLTNTIKVKEKELSHYQNQFNLILKKTSRYN